MQAKKRWFPWRMWAAWWPKVSRNIFPKKKRIILQFETHIIRRIKNIMSIMEIAESREFITIHDVSLLRGDCYTLVIEFSGKVTNVDFILEQFQTKKLI